MAAGPIGFEHCRSPLPFPPGASPFHIKGEFYRHLSEALQFLDDKYRGAMSRVLEREGLLAFASQKFLASLFYDLLPLPRIVMCMGEVRKRDVRELTTRIGHSAVERQIEGTYSGLLGTMTAHNFAQRFVQIVRHFYDFGPMTITPASGGARLQRIGVPLCAIEWWCLVSVPFVTVPLSRSGATDVHVEWRVEPAGARGGVPLGNALWDIRWQAAGA